MPTSQYDLAVMGGMVVDGTGLPRRRLDLGISNGKVIAVGHVDARHAARVIDASGLVVSPGIIDAHTHYDPHLTFDPFAQCSCFHGVTTVLAGNCGFSVAPCRREDRDFITGIFAKVEGMDPVALSGIRWGFESFAEYATMLTGKLGINAVCYVGHSNLRRWVMGPDASERAATPEERSQMAALLSTALRDGAAGLSSSSAPTHLDGDGRPIPSRLADSDELIQLAACLRAAAKGSITYLPASAIGGLDGDDEALLIEMAKAAGVPVITQGVGARNKVDAPTATWDAAQAFLDRATLAGHPVYSILNVRPFDRPLHLDESNQHYLAVPTWNHWLRQPRESRLELLRDDATRDEMRFAVENYNRDPRQGTTLPPPLWDDVYIDDSAQARHEGLTGQSIAEVARTRNCAPADVVLDLALADSGETKLRWRTESPKWAAAVGEAQRDRRMILGTSDGGAHLARDDGADWSSYFLRYWVLDRGHWTLEEGVRLITSIPATILGLHDRGIIRPGYWADLMIFDPSSIGPGRKEFTRDLPGGAGRYRANARGVHATIVNGVPIVIDDVLTDDRPGMVLSPQ